MTSPLAHHRVPVAGGDLFVGVWPARRPDAPLVVAIHGGTSSHRIWFAVAEALDGRATLVAPDYRGANGSEQLGPPYGLRAHGDDVRRVADFFGASRVVLAGWSLGAFIAASASEALGERAKGTVLVDGALPLALPAGIDLATMQDALIEPAMRRYRMKFASRAEHRAVWRAHPALQDPALWRPELAEAIGDELEETSSGLRFRVDLESLRTDVLDTLRPDGRDAVARLKTPATFVWAERGLEDEPVGYYPLAAARDFTQKHGLRLAEGHGLNHYALMLAPRGARLVADEIARYL